MILNTTRKTTLCKRVEKAISSLSKARGLMFRRSLKGGLLMVFEKEQRVGIWMICMLMPLDILWIDKRGKIVFLKEHAKPWLYFGSRKAAFVLELKAGTVKKTGTRIGDILYIEP